MVLRVRELMPELQVLVVQVAAAVLVLVMGVIIM